MSGWGIPGRGGGHVGPGDVFAGHLPLPGGCSPLASPLLRLHGRFFGLPFYTGKERSG